MNKQDRAGVRTAQDIERKYNLSELVVLVEEGKVSNKQAREIFQEMVNNGGSPKELFIGGVQGIQLSLKKSKDFNPKLVREGDLPFVCVPVGGVQKTLVIEIDGEEYGQYKIGANVSDANYTQSVRAQKHGAHKVSAYLVAELNGVSVATDPIEYEVAWVGTLLEEDEE